MFNLQHCMCQSDSLVLALSLINKYTFKNFPMLLHLFHCTLVFSKNSIKINGISTFIFLGFLSIMNVEELSSMQGFAKFRTCYNFSTV